MNNYNLGRMLPKDIYRPQVGGLINNAQGGNTAGASFTPENTNTPKPPEIMYSTSMNTMQMNTLESMDRSLYIKDLLKLPRNMNELLFILQKQMSQAEFNQRFLNHINTQRNLLSQMQAQILAQLQGLNTSQMQTALQQQMAKSMQSMLKDLPIATNSLINLNEIAMLLQANGKDAITKLITAMAAASQSGINDLSQMKDTAKLINASIAAAGQNNPTQTLKTLMLLYLPWLPLQDGVGFDLEIEASQSANPEDSILVITITTKNYGIVVATLILETSNSVHTSIECSNEFPKDELQIRIEKDQTHYAMQSVISFETKNSNPQKSDNNPNAQAKINMSNTNEINPYMLLMAHTIIRHVIEIDNNASIGGLPSHID